MKKHVFAVCLLAGGAAFGAVTVTDWTQDPSTSQVTVHYTLTDAPAIVTLDVCTNGVSIGADNLSRVIGDANMLVQPSAGTRTIKWRPDYAWDGHLFTDNEVTVKAVAWPTNDPPPYMAVNLACTNGAGVTSVVRYYAASGALPGGISNDLWRGEWLLMRRIPAAGREFTMGSPVNESFHVSKLDERTYDPWVKGTDDKRDPTKSIRALPETCHVVALTKDFYMGVFPITCAQFDYIHNIWTGYGESTSKGTAYKRWKAPAQGVTWDTARGANTWQGSAPAADSSLGKLCARTGIAFDLPTEAQWEFACRAGTMTSLNSGKEISSAPYAQGASSAQTMREVMWSWCYSGDEHVAASMVGSQTEGIPVGLLKPNAWGLYDMHGNVCEWCLDWVDGTPLADAVDPIGLASSSINTKAIRGGAVAQWSYQCRSGTRMGFPPALSNSGWLAGIRVICPAVVTK